MPNDVTEELPSERGVAPNKKCAGFRWQDPTDEGNGVRIDQGNPNVSQPMQYVDHVIVRFNVRILGVMEIQFKALSRKKCRAGSYTFK